MSSKDRHINFTLLRDRVLARAERSGKNYWRTLDEMTDAPEFEEFVAREFPQHAEEWHDPLERRAFMKIMGASLALAGLTGCAIQPTELAIPAVKPDPQQKPGKAQYYATAMPAAGGSTPLLVRSNDGRPTKVEGNDQHPASMGATDLWAQASILGFYDPDRSQNTQLRGDIRRWSDFVNAIKTELENQRPKQGAGLRFLTEAVNSPTQAAQLKAILQEFPQARWYQYEPVGRGNARAGTILAFGQPANPVYDLAKAERLVSIDADVLAAKPGNLAYMRQFGEKRKPEEGKEISRVYAVETTLTTTGMKADHRLALKPSQVENFVRAVAQGVGVAGISGQADGEKATKFAAALAKDLKAHAGKSLVLVGDEQPAMVHALAHAINETLNNVGATVRFTEALEPVSSENPNSQDALEGLKTLTGELYSGKVDTLILMGVNPLYDAPVDLNFGDAMQKAKLRVHHGLYFDETAEQCHWHIPAAHYLEMFSDTRAYDGTVTLIQPLIAPLYDACKSPHEVLNAFVKEGKPSGYETLQAAYQGKITGDFTKGWRKAVHDGMLPNSAAAEKGGLKVNAGNLASGAKAPAGSGKYEIAFRADPKVYDGRFANNGWLQELPHPLSKITWDNVAFVSPKTAKELKAEMDYGSKGGNTNVSLATIDIKGKTMTNVPLWVMAGQPDDVITVFLGYGRTKAGRVGGDAANRVGYNAYTARTSEAMWFAQGATVTTSLDTYEIASTQTHFTMENRNIVHEATLEEFKAAPASIHAKRGEDGKKEPGEEHIPGYKESLYPQVDYKDQKNQENFGANKERHAYNYAWSMAIDVASCVGCNACIVACQSENNIPVVGKEQVARSREMQWLRVDTYYKTAEQDQRNTDSPMGDQTEIDGAYFMPMPCQQCENAPCETVCPVHATVHSAEGLNDMAYNRCVGTRYCSNNCPFKVRRFNFFLYQDFDTPQYQIMRNPEVSVRSRGVMEKCTYCVQRIQGAKITSEVEGREVRDGEILTACQSVCPTNAITFGDQNNANSAVAKLKKEERNYGLLPDLNVQPRTTYLGTVSNPNEELSKG